jgi:hypothetical protein
MNLNSKGKLTSSIKMITWLYQTELPERNREKLGRKDRLRSTK